MCKSATVSFLVKVKSSNYESLHFDVRSLMMILFINKILRGLELPVKGIKKTPLTQKTWYKVL